MFEFVVNKTPYQITEYKPYSDYVGVVAYGSKNVSLKISGRIYPGCKTVPFWFIDDSNDEHKQPITETRRLFYNSRNSDGSVKFASWTASRLYAPKHIQLDINGFYSTQSVNCYHFHHHNSNGEYFGPVSVNDFKSRRRYDLDVNGIGLHRIDVEFGTLVKFWSLGTDGYSRHCWSYVQIDGPAIDLRSISMYDFE